MYGKEAAWKGDDHESPFLFLSVTQGYFLRRELVFDKKKINKNVNIGINHL